MKVKDPSKTIEKFILKMRRAGGAQEAEKLKDILDNTYIGTELLMNVRYQVSDWLTQQKIPPHLHREARRLIERLNTALKG